MAPRTTPLPTSLPPVGRRGMLAATAVALGSVSVLGGTSPAAAAELSSIPMLQPGGDWAAALANSPAIQLVPGATYTLSATLDLPSGATIYGNGATVTIAGEANTAMTITQKTKVTLHGIRFLGAAQDPINSAPTFAHIAVRVTRSVDVTIENCQFEHWRGAGVVVTGSANDDVFRSGAKIRSCTFRHCYFGVSIADRAEYGLLSDNHFLGCRLGIWNSSGNWLITANVMSSCYGALYTIASTSPYGAQSSDNWAHGNVTGNVFNHSTSGGGARWTSSAVFPIGGPSEDPGSGIVIRGVLPPTFSGNTLWYTDIRATNLIGTRWLLSGCTLSNLTIRASGTVPVHLVGTQSNGTANAPRFEGNVKDLLPV